MKRFIGKKVEFVVQGFPMPFSATVVKDLRDKVLIRGEGDKFVRRIIKSHITSYMPLEKVDEEDVNMLILSCENPTIGCHGVQFVKEGEGFNQRDFDSFMAPCKSKCETCRAGSRRELRSADGTLLRDMLTGTMFGEYPEEKK